MYVIPFKLILSHYGSPLSEIHGHKFMIYHVISQPSRLELNQRRYHQLWSAWSGQFAKILPWMAAISCCRALAGCSMVIRAAITHHLYHFQRMSPFFCRDSSVIFYHVPLSCWFNIRMP